MIWPHTGDSIPLPGEGLSSLREVFKVFNNRKRAWGEKASFNDVYLRYREGLGTPVLQKWQNEAKLCVRGTKDLGS